MEIVAVLLSESGVEITLNKSVNEICEHYFLRHKTHEERLVARSVY